MFFDGAIQEVTLFCREFEYCRIYAFYVLIFWVKKCACAIFYAFSKSATTKQTQQTNNVIEFQRLMIQPDTKHNAKQLFLHVKIT